MRAQRLVQILLLLQVHRRLTAGEMARRLEVSARTVQRDLDALSASGVPVYADRGRGGGWTLAADFRTRLNGLTPAETASLFLGTTAHVLADLGLDGAAAAAMTKLMSAVPASTRGEADRAQDRVLIDHSDWWDTREPSPWLPVIRQGLWSDRWVRLEYGRAPEPVDVAPLGLVAKKRDWYLVARRADGEFRTYRVARVRAVDVSDRPFDRPDGFDLAEYWAVSNERYFAGLRTYPVRLRVRGSARSRLYWAPNAAVEVATDRSDGWWDVTMTFENAAEARIVLLGLAGDVLVVEPHGLRDDLVRAARALVADHDADRSHSTVTGTST